MTTTTPWHANGESVFAVMRLIDADVIYHRMLARALYPPHGTRGIGSADFDHTLKAEVGESYLSALRKGRTPEEALEQAIQDGRWCVAKWNATGCKSRVFTSSIHELHRWEELGDDVAWTHHRRILAAVAHG